MPFRSLAAALCLSVACVSIAKSEAPDPDAATELVLRALKARSEERNDDFAALILPQDMEDLQRSYVERWKAAGEIGQAEPYARNFPGVESSGHLAKMDAAEVFALAESVRKPLVPGPPLNHRAVGFAIDGDVTYVASSDQYGGIDMYPVFKLENGELRMGLQVEDRVQLRTYLKTSDLKKGGATQEEIREQLTPKSISKIDVLTLVTDDKSVWIVSRATAEFPGGEESAVGLYQIGGRSPLIELLDKENPAALDDQRRAALEEGLMNEVKRARAKRANP